MLSNIFHSYSTPNILLGYEENHRALQAVKAEERRNSWFYDEDYFKETKE